MLYCNQEARISGITEFSPNIFQRRISSETQNARRAICALPSTGDCVQIRVTGERASSCATLSSGSNQSAPACPLASMLAPAKRAFEVCKFRGRSRQEVHADDVEAHFRGSFARQLTHVVPSEAAQHVALLGVDRGLGWRHIMRRARLHFDETKQRPLPCNQIQIAGQISTRPPMRHHNVALALQIRTGGILAFDSCE
jgi:hypothetical protein